MKSLYIILSFLVVINICLLIGVYFTQKCSKPKSTKKASPNERIIGGKRSKISEFPFFAGMLIRKGFYNIQDPEPYEEEDQYICGTTIIGNYWVITAAHCTNNFVQPFGFPVESGFIRSGTSAWKQNKKTQKYTRDHNFQKIIQHEEYDDVKLSHDISLVRVVEAFIGKFEKRIKLAGKHYPYKAGSQCRVLGFGLTNVEQYSATPFLNSVKIQIVNHTICQTAYDGLENGEGLVNKWNICAGSPHGGKDACKFDSGGPLVQNGILIGIVSSGEGCANAKYPGLYTRVGLFYNWIAKKEHEMNEGTGVKFVYNTRRFKPTPTE